MRDFKPETSDDRNSAQTKQTTYQCGHENCTASFDSPEDLAEHTVNCEHGSD